MRHIEGKMVDYISKRLVGSGLAEIALKERRPRQLFITAMQTCVGIREVGGNNKGPLVELIQKTLGDAEQEAWCMALQQTILAYVEEKLQIFSGVYASEHCLTVWKKTPDVLKVKYKPLPGAICIWRHGDTSNGHTGMVLDYGAKVMHLVEGNTEAGINPAGTIERDGGGVYFTERNVSGNGNMKVVGFIKPFPETV